MIGHIQNLTCFRSLFASLCRLLKTGISKSITNSKVSDCIILCPKSTFIQMFLIYVSWYLYVQKHNIFKGNHSHSRTAVNSQSGVKTPASGIFTGLFMLDKYPDTLEIWISLHDRQYIYSLSLYWWSTANTA